MARKQQSCGGIMLKGKVKWFSDLKGSGFIEAGNGSQDIFVHHSAIKSEGYRSLVDGEEVTYELTEGEKGPAAVNVTRIAEMEEPV